MEITLKPVNDQNRAAILQLSVRDDQPFIASNARSLETAEENPGIARPFAIYAGDRPVGFTMFAFDEEYEDPEDRYWLWRFMIDKDEQGKGYGKAALEEIIRYFREQKANVVTLSTKPENETALHLYHQFGFLENGEMNDGEIVLKLTL